MEEDSRGKPRHVVSDLELSRVEKTIRRGCPVRRGYRIGRFISSDGSYRVRIIRIEDET